MSSVDLFPLWRYTGAMARPKADRTYSVEVRSRVTPEQAELFKRAASHAAERRGTGTFSDWVREVLVRAAREELGDSAVAID